MEGFLDKANFFGSILKGAKIAILFEGGFKKTLMVGLTVCFL